MPCQGGLFSAIYALFRNFFFHLVMVVSTSEDFFSSIFDELFIDPCLPERQVLREGLKKGDVSSQVNNIGG